MRLVLLGAGSMRCGPPVVGALAGYFGERELEVRLYDPDSERLELIGRLATASFLMEAAPHRVAHFTDFAEALEGADLVILAIGESAARRILGEGSPEGRDQAIGEATERLARSFPDGVPVLDLTRDTNLSAEFSRLEGWPPTLSATESRSLAFQILRWIHGEEPAHMLTQQEEQSPVRAWLDASIPR